MQITFPKIYHTYNDTSPKTYSGFKLKPQLACDTVCFGSRKDLLQLTPKTIFSRIESSIKDTNCFMGKGDEGTVYSIKDSNYCVKIPHPNLTGKLADYRKSLSFNISEKDRINHIKAHLGDGAVIMEKIDGTTVLNQPEIAGELAHFPVSSFNKFLKQITYANNNGMLFDGINQNVIINPKNKSITAIDFIDANGLYYSDLLPLRMIYGSLVNKGVKPENQKLIKNKIILAAVEEFKPGNKPCLDTSEFDFEDFLSATNTENINNLHKNIKELSELKDRELAGINVKKELNSAYTKTKELLNK